jgi:hypothetical protein
MTTPIAVERYVKFGTDKATLITVERLSVRKSSSVLYCTSSFFADCIAEVDGSVAVGE